MQRPEGNKDIWGRKLENEEGSSAKILMEMPLRWGWIGGNEKEVVE